MYCIIAATLYVYFFRAIDVLAIDFLAIDVRAPPMMLGYMLTSLNGVWKCRIHPLGVDPINP